MELKKYLIVNSNGSTRITSYNKPKLATNEIAIQLNLSIPDKLFEKPTLVANITVDEELATQELISAKVIDNAKEIISNSLGLELRIKTVEQEKETCKCGKKILS